jgi:catechol 2,3-dioxygenase-like lactoylglutathione lyase family enzyme
MGEACGWFTRRRAQASSKHRPHDRYRPGLHHFAFNAESRKQVDAFHRDVLQPMHATVLNPPQIWPQYSEGYYTVFFLDPDGIKLELAHTPAQAGRNDRRQLSRRRVRVLRGRPI